MSLGSSGLPLGQVPVGSIVAYAGLAPEQFAADYWLICKGQQLDGSSNAYSNLFQAIGDQYGSSGTFFNLPDLRGMFLRGVGPRSTEDPSTDGRYKQGDPSKTPIPPTEPLVGSVQDDQFKSHSHALGPDNNGYHECGDYSVYNVGTETANATGYSGGHETRPVNVFVYFLIYAGPPVGTQAAA